LNQSTLIESTDEYRSNQSMLMESTVED